MFIGFIGVDSAFVLVYVDLYGLNKRSGVLQLPGSAKFEMEDAELP